MKFYHVRYKNNSVFFEKEKDYLKFLSKINDIDIQDYEEVIKKPKQTLLDMIEL